MKLMKRIIAIVLLVTGLLSVGCNKQVDEGEPAPRIVINNHHFFARSMPVNELPEGYEYIGVLSKESANNTGAEGYKMYALKEKDSFCGFYLYQETGTPIGDNLIDSTKRQWAYVYWELDED